MAGCRTNCRLRFLCWKQSNSWTRCGLRSSLSSLISLSAVTLMPCTKPAGRLWHAGGMTTRPASVRKHGRPRSMDAGAHTSPAFSKLIFFMATTCPVCTPRVSHMGESQPGHDARRSSSPASNGNGRHTCVRLQSSAHTSLCVALMTVPKVPSPRSSPFVYLSILARVGASVLATNSTAHDDQLEFHHTPAFRGAAGA